MVKKLSREQKAWATRKANKKKQVKLDQEYDKAFAVDGAKINTPLKLNLPKDITKVYTPAPVLTLCGQLEDAIMLLEVRISNSIAKINSLM